MPSFPDSAFLFSADVRLLASQVPASFSILSLQGLTLLAICLESQQGNLRLTVKLPCVQGRTNPAGAGAYSGLFARLLSAAMPSRPWLLRNLLTLPAIEWVSVGQQGASPAQQSEQAERSGQVDSVRQARQTQEMQVSCFLNRRQLLVQGHTDKQVCLTLTGEPGPGATIPLGRLPTRLPVNPSPATGLLGINRHITLCGPGTLTLSIGGYNDLCDALRAAQLDESSPLLLLSC
jgi:hypothetical protein